MITIILNRLFLKAFTVKSGYVRLILLPLILLFIQIGLLTPLYAALPLLVQPEALHKTLLQSPQNIIMIDTRTKEEYALDHLPSAINLPVNQLQQTRHNIKNRIISPLEFQQKIESLGIKPNDHLIFYAGDNPLTATRALWIFEFYGHTNNSILDGGLPAWEWLGFPLEKETTTLPPSHYAIKLDSKRFASKFNTLMASQSNDTLLIDARPKAEYEGRTTRGTRAGHIPNAVNLDFTTLFTTDSIQEGDARISTFLKTDKFKQLLKKLPQKENIILYCNTGEEASALYFAFRLMNRNVAIYDGSWAEWSADKSLPIAMSQLNVHK